MKCIEMHCAAASTDHEYGSGHCDWMWYQEEVRPVQEGAAFLLRRMKDHWMLNQEIEVQKGDGEDLIFYGPDFTITWELPQPRIDIRTDTTPPELILELRTENDCAVWLGVLTPKWMRRP